MPVDGKTRLRSCAGSTSPRYAARVALLMSAAVFGAADRLETQMVKEHGLTLPHFEVLLLHAGAAKSGISQQDLSERLLVTKGTSA